MSLNHVSRTSAWFGDLGDGIHKGDQNDPRVAVIQVVPEEVRFWISTGNVVTKAADIVTSAVTGKVAAPGELCTLTKEEVRGYNACYCPAADYVITDSAHSRPASEINHRLY